MNKNADPSRCGTPWPAQLRGRVLAGLPLAAAAARRHAGRAGAAGVVRRPRGNHRHRAEARGEPADGADQHPGHRLRAARRNCRSTSSTTTCKFLPSVSFTTLGPGFGLAYFRGVASGENNNHSGPSPSVGMYLDEQPITTIQGALDVHLYDIARVEALAGPQGTLYGASSQAGTIRIITNQPDPTGFEAGYGARRQHGRRRRHGLPGRGLRQPAGVRDGRRAPGRLGAPRRRLHRQRAGDADVPDLRRLHQQQPDAAAGLRDEPGARQERLQRRRHLRRPRRAARRPERQLDASRQQ